MRRFLYLMRHGIAGPGHPDPERTLTAKGVAQLQRAALALKQARFPVGRLYVSPYTRARQTAALVAPALGLEPEEERLLQAGCSFDDAAEVVDRHGDGANVMLVGHQPDMGNIVHVLTGCRAHIRPATLAVIELARMRPHGGILAGLYDPALMARWGRPDGLPGGSSL